MEQVSNEFLDFEKPNFPRRILDKTESLIKQFSTDYGNKKASEINISGLSCRSRIYLLAKIMEEKRNRLPKGFNTANNKDFKALCKNRNNFEKEYWFPQEYTSWGAGNPYSYWKIQDQQPTIFLIGDQKYTLKLLYTHKQPGNGIITGTYDLKHVDICSKINETGIPVEEIFEKILQQKKTGESIKTNSFDHDRLLNGYSFLLDFEIARRKVPGDIYKDLPLITCFPFLMKHFLSLPGAPVSFKTVYETTILKLFEGENRKKGVEEIIKTMGNIIPTTVKEMRETLNDFHQSDEASSYLSSLESQSQPRSQPY